MTRVWRLAILLAFGVTATRAAGPTIAIDVTSPAGKVSPLFYGLMTEEINHSYDGGLYAELVRNRAFLDDAASPAHWSVVQFPGAATAIALDRSEPLNAAIGTSLRLDVTTATMTSPSASRTKATGAFPSDRTPAIAPRSTRRQRRGSMDRSPSRFRAAMAAQRTLPDESMV